MVMRAYERTSRDGRTINARTAAMLNQADDFLRSFHKTSLPDLLQGSYNAGGVQASAGTHDGGGAIDLASTSKDAIVLKILKDVGFAIWKRPELYRNGRRLWGPHLHGIAIGDKEMSDGARKQVQDYFAGLDGLAGHAKDTSYRPARIPSFIYPLQSVDLSNVAEQARKGGRVALPGVKRVQRALNWRTGTALLVDGKFGKQTKAAYARWERQCGGDGDGIPGEFSLKKLGLARFRVVD